MYGSRDTPGREYKCPACQQLWRNDLWLSRTHRHTRPTHPSSCERSRYRHILHQLQLRNLQWGAAITGHWNPSELQYRGECTTSLSARWNNNNGSPCVFYSWWSCGGHGNTPRRLLFVPWNTTPPVSTVHLCSESMPWNMWEQRTYRPLSNWWSILHI